MSHWLSLAYFLVSPVPIMQKAWQAVGLAREGMRAALSPDWSVLNQFATSRPRGNKSSQSAEIRVLRFSFYGRKNYSMAGHLSCHCMSVVWISVWAYSKGKWNVSEVAPVYGFICPNLGRMSFERAHLVFSATWWVESSSGTPVKWNRGNMTQAGLTIRTNKLQAVLLF